MPDLFVRKGAIDFEGSRYLKTRKNRKPVRAGLPGLTASPAAGPQATITRRTGQSRAGAGRLDRAMRDARSTDSATPPQKKQDARARAVGRWENEGGRTEKAAAVAGSSERSSATKPVRSAAAQRGEKALNAKVDPASAARSTKKGPRASPLLGHEKQRTAEARVKESRIKRAGLESRLLGHVSAAGKRAQARRDSKN